jgi:uncharacterized protein YecT (DUF1311 family)
MCTFLGALVLAVGLVAAVGPPASGVASSGPPVIQEPFARSALPCPSRPRTTLDHTGCLERAVLKSDRRIDARARTLFGLLSSPARRAFVRGERLWLSYRRSSCEVEASALRGGSAEPLLVLSCVLQRNRSHLADLAALERAHRQR